MIGFAIAVPVGPIGVLTIRRTLANGQLHGLATGMGAATADGIYGLISALGLTLLSDMLIRYETLLGIAGGLFLLYLGLSTMLSRPATEPAHADARRGLIGAYISTLLLTLTNPITIVFYAAIIASTAVSTLTGIGGALLVLGVFAGSAAWWLMLTTGVTVAWRRLPEHRRGSILLWANRLSGVLIIAFALAMLLG